ncbi:hypothetical protein HDU87_004042 [Geranomyces variabilis]|uniref:Deacetylase sirtuin-type domain-containing protein n=1 Tax=Geranomyces variabilis TaxID=109894 RepID=A0AAD5TR24_9FUNG|nr:hypothetical protein HDU87_004042 [Geranomyces variabilis]
MTHRFRLNDLDHEEPLAAVAGALHKSRRCVVVTGAGISVSGGIPDFRSADGLYNLVKARYPAAVVKGKDLFDAALFRDPTSTAIFYTFMAELKAVVSKAEITPTHRFLKQLDVDHKLLRCYTQNIDGLELRLEMSANLNDKQSARIVQLHGDLDNVVCTMCNSQYPFDATKSEVFRAGSPPPCPECETMQSVRMVVGKRLLAVGTLRPNIVLYNEHHSKGEQIANLAAYDIKKHPDLLVIMGTSLNVVGIKRLVKDLAKSVHERNGIVVFINSTEVGREWDNIIDYHIQGATDDVVARLRAETQTLEDRATARVQRHLERKEIRERMAREMSVDCGAEGDLLSRKRPAKTDGSTSPLKKRKTATATTRKTQRAKAADCREAGQTLLSMPSLTREDSGTSDYSEDHHDEASAMLVDVQVAAAAAEPRKAASKTAARKPAKASAACRQTKLAPGRVTKKTATTAAAAAKTKKVITRTATAPQLTLASMGMRAAKPRMTNNSLCANDLAAEKIAMMLQPRARKSARLNKDS